MSPSDYKSIGRVKCPTTRQPILEELERRLTLSVVFIESEQRLGDSTSCNVKLGDLDGDGDLDAFVGNLSQQSDSIWLNDGLGNFSENGQSLGGIHTRDIALGDLDGDGDLDAFVAKFNFRPDYVWLNDGCGNFIDSGQRLGQSDSGAVILGDVDGDGDLDAFVANDNRDTGQEPNKVWLNDGNGNFHDSGQRLGKHSYAAALADLDGDGDLDAFVANSEDRDDHPEPNQVWMNDGHGNFSDTGQNLGSSNSSAVSLGDLDGDGDVDAFVGNTSRDTVWLNDGQGNFSDTDQRLGDSRDTMHVSLGNLDGDGDIDAIAVSPSFGHKVWLNDGHSNFDETTQNIGGSDNCSVALGDLDGDGDLDAFVVGRGPNRIWFNQGAADERLAGDANHDSRFNERDIAIVLATGKYLTGEPATWTDGDWNGDGIFDQLDIVVALQTGTYLSVPDE